MAQESHLTTRTPKWLETAISRRLITRKVANELCDWAYHEGVVYHGIVEERVYYRAISGDITEAIHALASILRSITRRAERHGKTSWGEEQATIWRKTLGSTLLLEIRAELIYKVRKYLPRVIEAGENPDADAELFQQVLDTYK